MNRSRLRGRAIAAAAALALVFVGCSTGESGSDGGGASTTMRLGMVAADGSVQHQGAVRFADQVMELSGGELTINVFPAGQIGSDESLGQDLSKGDLEFAFLNQGSMAGMDPLLDFHYLPYIVTNYAQADELYFGEGVIPTTMTETLMKHDIRALGWYELEFRGFSTSKGEARTPADIAGQKVRVPGSAAIGAFFESVGAQPVTVPFPELYTALQQGTVDGQDNGLLITFDNNLQEANPYYTMTRHVYATGTIAMSDTIYSGLSDEQKGWIETAAKDAQDWQVAAERELTDSYIQQMKDSGATVVELTDAEMEAFQTVGRDVWLSMDDTYGADRVAQLRQEVEAAASLS